MSIKGGRVFKIGNQGVNVFVEPFLNVGDDIAGESEWGIKLNFTLLFPER